MIYTVFIKQNIFSEGKEAIPGSEAKKNFSGGLSEKNSSIAHDRKQNIYWQTQKREFTD